MRQLLSHQAGLPALRDPFAADELFDWDRICSRLAAEELWFELGSAHAEQVLFDGHLCGELGGFSTDLDRQALENPPGARELTVVNSERWRRAEIPAVGGHSNAMALARFYLGLQRGGELDGVRLVQPKAVEAMFEPQMTAIDGVLGEEVSWAPGIGVNEEDWGMGGIGGSYAGIEPRIGLVEAYATATMGDQHRRRRSHARSGCPQPNWLSYRAARRLDAVARVSPPRRQHPPLALCGVLALALALAGCGSGSDAGPATVPAARSAPMGGAGGSAGSGASAGSRSDATAAAKSRPGQAKLAAGQEKAAPQPPAPTESLRDATHADIYFTSGEQFKPVERKIPDSDDPLDYAADAVVAGPTAAEKKGITRVQTLIPAGTGVKDVSLDDEGTATVELSAQFLDGIPSDSGDRTAPEEASLNGRLGQITYTLTAFKEVKDVKAVSGGVTLTGDRNRADYRKPAGGPRKVSHDKGSKSLSARAAQRRLARLKFLPKSAVNGKDGYRTQQAVTAFQAWEGLGRDGVVGPLTTAALRDANRPRPSSRGPARRIEIYREKGVVLLIRDHKLKRAIHVSAGRPGYDTPSGTYSVFRKELQSWSVPFSTWLPYASYFNNGIALHEYPDVPSYPASHGCVRVPSPEAKLVYRFAKLGTAVVVY